MTSIVTSFVAPNLTRVAVVKIQGRDFTVRQTPKKVTTVWLGPARITKKDQPGVFHDAVQAAFTEWEERAQAAAHPGQDLGPVVADTVAAVGGVIRETTVEHWGPDAVAVTREYDARMEAARAALAALSPQERQELRAEVLREDVAPLEGTPGSLPCFHVTTTRGEVYGVAAQTQQEARQMTQDRLRREGSTDRPGKAERVGSWGAEYGTVLHY
jgi:hypothetical protein